jgi:hypothetical protein
MVYKVAKIKGKEYLIKYSDSKDKKYEVEVDGKKIRFAQVGYRMFPGQKRGQNYCTRSYGQVNLHEAISKVQTFGAGYYGDAKGRGLERFK